MRDLRGHQSAAAGTAVLMGAIALAAPLNYGFGLALAWLLPAAEFGRVSVLLTVLLLATSVLAAGFPWALARRVARDESGAGRVAGRRRDLPGRPARQRRARRGARGRVRRRAARDRGDPARGRGRAHRARRGHDRAARPRPGPDRRAAGHPAVHGRERRADRRGRREGRGRRRRRRAARLRRRRGRVGAADRRRCRRGDRLVDAARPPAPPARPRRRLAVVRRGRPHGRGHHRLRADRHPRRPAPRRPGRTGTASASPRSAATRRRRSSPRPRSSSAAPSPTSCSPSWRGPAGRRRRTPGSSPACAGCRSPSCRCCSCWSSARSR